MTSVSWAGGTGSRSGSGEEAGPGNGASPQSLGAGMADSRDCVGAATVVAGVVGVDGTVYRAGDSDEAFSIQST